MSTKGPLQERWKEVWTKHLEQCSAPDWTNDRWREPFQLLGASLIYTFNAMEVMPEDMFHEKVRPTKGDSQGIWKLLNGNSMNPDFRQDGDEQFNELVSTMHMASSSFRLPTALYLMEKEMKAIGSVIGPLTDMLKGSSSSDDWARNKLKTFLPSSASPLKCCKQNKQLIDSEKIALAMILEHRDEFGHGDEGHEQRSQSISEFRCCRIFEAQILLAELGVEQLGRMK